MADKVEEKTDGYGAAGAIRKAADKADAKKMGPDNRGGRAFYDERKTGRVSGIHQADAKPSEKNKSQTVQSGKTGKNTESVKAEKSSRRDSALGAEHVKNMQPDKTSESTLRPERNEHFDNEHFSNAHLKDTVERAEKASGTASVSGNEKKASSVRTERNSRNVNPENVTRKASKPARRGSLKQERNTVTPEVKEKRKLQKPNKTIRRRGGNDL